MFWTICVIVRAIRLRGFASSSHFGFDVPAPVWQLPQHRLSDVVNTPIVPMNSSTGMPLSTWTFLKTLSDTCGVAGVAAATWDEDCPAACSVGSAPVAKAMLTSHAVMTAAAGKISALEDSFMDVPPRYRSTVLTADAPLLVSVSRIASGDPVNGTPTRIFPSDT